MSKPKPSYLYVVEDARGRCKIGHGRSPKARRAGLATGNADALTLILKVKVQGRSGTEAEAAAHALLGGRRIRGEWFDVSKNVAAAVVRMAAANSYDPTLVDRVGAFDVACGDPDLSAETRSARVDLIHRAAQAVEDVAPGLLVSIDSWNEIYLDAWRSRHAKSARAAA